MTANDTNARLSALAQECAREHGLDAESVTLTPAGKRRVLAVVVDTDITGLAPTDATSPVESVDLDAVAEVTRSLSARLDQEDVLGETPYTLEVSSPGIGRRLTEFTHYRRNVGRKVRLQFTAREEMPKGITVNRSGTADATGRLVSVTPERLVLTPDPYRSSPGAKPKALPDITVALADVTNGTVQVDFAGHEEDN